MARLDQVYDIHLRSSTRGTCTCFCEEEGVEAGRILLREKALSSMLCTGKMEQEMGLESSIVTGELGMGLEKYIVCHILEMAYELHSVQEQEILL